MSQLRFSPTSHFRRYRWARVQAAIYLGLVTLATIWLVPWGQVSLVWLVALAALGLSIGLAVWSQIKVAQLQARMHSLETHLRQLHTQKATQAINAQSLLQVEPESFFNKEQTRH